jgi:hypothetical protein
MKKLFVILFFIILAFGCEKHAYDYRNKFIGEYIFWVHYHSNLTGLTVDTTYSFKGKIWYSNSCAGCISINFSENKTTSAVLYEDGSIEWDRLYGEFETTEKVWFRLFGGGQARHFYWNVTGEKTK